MKKAELYEKLSESTYGKNVVRCKACSHRCVIKNRQSGICGVRKNSEGDLYLAVYGKVVAKNIDPIEKKPFFNFLPGTTSYSIGTFGCNFSCGFCQNYDISRFKGSQYEKEQFYGETLNPEEIVSQAEEAGCKSIAYTYNEPGIYIEFVHDTAKLAKEKGIKNVMVTNGYLTEEALDYLTYTNEKGKKENLIDAMNIDLKAFNSQTYRKYCGATKGLQPVLETIKRAYEKGIHLEITTLLIPEENDSEEELKKTAEFVYSLDNRGDVPWHISRFFPMYKFASPGYVPTPLETLEKAKEIGEKAGLKNVYLGNV